MASSRLVISGTVTTVRTVTISITNEPVGLTKKESNPKEKRTKKSWLDKIKLFIGILGALGALASILSLLSN